MQSSQQDEGRSPAREGDRRGEAPAYTSARTRHRSRNPAKRLLPVMVMIAIAVLIARQQVPAFADWWERTFMPAEWQARSTCRDAAVADLQAGRYARLLDRGTLHQTPDGPYLAAMTFSVLNADGDEQVVEFSCYLDSQGQLYRLNRRPE